MKFWNSVDLTGNQTNQTRERIVMKFWNSVDLTGNQTTVRYWRAYHEVLEQCRSNW